MTRAEASNANYYYVKDARSSGIFAQELHGRSLIARKSSSDQAPDGVI